MTQLADPGKDLPPQAAKQARKTAWARPATKSWQTRLRNDRLSSWLATVPEHLREREEKRWL